MRENYLIKLIKPIFCEQNKSDDKLFEILTSILYNFIR
jgi:hypothetical protein